MKSLGISLAFAAALLATPALAQDEQQAPPQQQRPVQPTDQKGIGDWTVQCYPVHSATPCEMLEMQVSTKTRQRILAVLLAYAPNENVTLMRVSVPLGSLIQNGVVVSTDTYKSGALKFLRCDQAGCYAQITLTPDQVNALGKATTSKVEIVMIDGKHYGLSFSTKGFAEAYSAMAGLARAKAPKGNEPAPAPAQ